MKKILSFIFNKKFWLNKWTIIVTSIIIVVSGMAFTYLYNPSFVPQIIKSANKKVVDKIVGKELAEKIDETRDENGATSIRTLFNINKEENLARHCEKKEEKGKEQEKCYKTYKNEEYGFSVKYPEDLKIQKIENTPRFTFSEEPILEDTDQVAPIELIIVDKTLDQEINGIKKEAIKDYTEEAYKVNGIEGKRITGTFGLFYWGETQFTYIILQKDNQIFEWSGNTQILEVSDNFEKIVSTFSFK